VNAEATLIKVVDATIGYDAHPVVHRATLAIAAGEVVAVLGANGSGKSTLIRGILGIAPLFDGEIEVFGEPVRGLRRRWRLGYVPQRQVIGGGVPTTVTEVVTSGRLARVGPWRRMTGADRAHVRDAIAEVGLADRARDPVALLSGGQQRRVLIARALASDAEVLLLDEPTAGVDTETQEKLTETMAALVARGVTIALVTHELGPAAAIVTRAVQMRDGRITYDGRPRPADVRSHDVEHHHHDVGDVRRDRFGLAG
jgi:zinc transport system ATP-binding protein